MTFTQTKLFDVLAGVPLILWFGWSALTLRPALAADAAAILAGEGTLLTWLQALGLAASIAFYLLVVWLLLVREKPVRRAQGLLPYLCGFLGTFLSVGIFRLPEAQLSLPVAAAADLLVFGGSAAAFASLWALGRAFSIMPDARLLVTRGPYAHIRHPLYAAEIIVVAGIALQFQQPWAGLLAVATVALQVARSLFEEQVLAQTFPDYARYRARTKRFIPGVL
jgi:protein-S-isoprenylcysteine O-methyltransferase Ste14